MILRIMGLLGTLLCITAVGCGSGNPATFETSGKVTYNGQPVANGVVQLHPEGGGNSAVGNLESDGTFTLTTFKKDDGACAGTYKVTVQAFPDADDDAPASGLPGMELTGEGKPPVPLKYEIAGTTDLVVTINEGANELTLELKD